MIACERGAGGDMEYGGVWWKTSNFVIKWNHVVMHGLERRGKSQTVRQTGQTGKSRGTEGCPQHWSTGKTTTGKIAWNAKQNTRCTRAKKWSAKCRKKGRGSTSAATLQRSHEAAFSACVPSPSPPPSPSPAASLDGSIERGAATGCVWSRRLCDALSNKDKDSYGDGGRATQQKLRPTFDPQQEQQQQQGGDWGRRRRRGWVRRSMGAIFNGGK